MSEQSSIYSAAPIINTIGIYLMVTRTLFSVEWYPTELVMSRARRPNSQASSNGLLLFNYSRTAYTLLSRRTCHVQVETCHHLKIRTLRVFDYIYEALE